MRCKACDSILKDTNSVWRTVDVGGSPMRLMEDLCPNCRSMVDFPEDDDDPIPQEIRALFEVEWRDE